MISVEIPIERENLAVQYLRDQPLVIVLWMNQGYREHTAGEVWRDERSKARFGLLDDFDVTYHFHDKDVQIAMMFKLMFGGR